MSAQAFFTNPNVQYIARYVHQYTAIPVSVILAQMADETGYGTSYIWLHCYNPAGINGNGCVFPYQGYSNYADAAKGYVATYLNGDYNNVLAVARSGASPQAVAQAIGNSPWAGSHYILNGQPGGSLINIINNNNLTQYDSPAPLPSAVKSTPHATPKSQVPASGVPWFLVALFATSGLLLITDAVWVVEDHPKRLQSAERWLNMEVKRLERT